MQLSITYLSLTSLLELAECDDFAKALKPSTEEQQIQVYVLLKLSAVGNLNSYNCLPYLVHLMSSIFHIFSAFSISFEHLRNGL